MLKATLTALLMAASCAAFAQQISGLVVGISDGDTLTMLDESNVEYKIRLSAIDTPEKKQPFWGAAKEALSSLCFKRPAIADVVDKDWRGRTVATVYCDGIDTSAAMVRLGYAWVYTKYAKHRPDLPAIQNDAQAHRRGLWVDETAVPPWEWRKK